jgi:predicted Zn finger-like uncharacterized protein
MIQVECGTCKARYAVPEERVKGKLLKIRCKHCQSIIEVRGEGASGRSVLERSRRLWFLAIRRQRVGPITEQEVRERYRRGEIKAKTYAWRQGFTRWERLFDISEFQDLVVPTRKVEQVDGRPSRSTLPTPELSPTPKIEKEDDSTRPQRIYPPKADGKEDLDFDRKPILPSLGAQLAASSVSTDPLHAAPSPVVEEAREETTSTAISLGDMAGEEFITQDLESGPQGGAHLRAPEPAGAIRDTLERGRDEDLRREPPGRRRDISEDCMPVHLKAQRHENSVLFSLNHLRKMAGPPLKEANPPTGLTGIFALSPATPLPPPVRQPVRAEPPPRRSGLGLLMVIGAVGMVSGAVLILGILFLVQPEMMHRLFFTNETPEGKKIVVGMAAQGKTRQILRRGVVPPVLSEKPTFSAPDPIALPLLSPDGGSAEVQPKRSDNRPQPEVHSSQKQASSSASTAKTLTEASKDSTPAKRDISASVAKSSSRKARKQKRRGKVKEVSEKLDPERLVGAAVKDESITKKNVEQPKKEATESEGKEKVGGREDTQPSPVEEKSKKESVNPEPAESPPQTIGRDQIAQGMKRASDAIRVCHDKFGESGLITVEATIEGATGRIGAARVMGDFAGRPLGGCVLEAVKRTARFPKFSAAPVTIQYPFHLK